MITLAFLVIMSFIPGVHAMAFAERQDVQEFVNEVSAEYNLDRAQTLNNFSKIEPSAEVIQRITTPYEALPWNKYRQLFLTEKKISGGVAFWQKYKESLAKAEATYGVPAELIVAIIGIESAYGENSGKFPVLQALATLAFDYAPRGAFFRNELKQYLVLTEEHGLDPLAIKGSYAGAMGIPQFIASSYRKFAVDFDESPQVDIINNMQHAIASVGNYFKEHGWQPNREVVRKLKNPKQQLKQDNHSKLLELDGESGKEYFEGLDNFYVITRYNHSDNYALAAYQLSQAIAKRYNQQ